MMQAHRPSAIKRIAICTGGGDAPGLNAVIGAVTWSALNRGWDVLGIRDGLTGILQPELYQDGGVMQLTRDRVHGIAHLGGTILGTTNKGKPLVQADKILDWFKREQVDALVSVGGDGSLTIAHELHQRGLAVVGVPKTIDNDLDKTFTTFGFDSAVTFASDCIDRLHSTAQSHQRIMVVEVMGRYAGWIALHAGLAGGAHAILMPEIPYDLEKVAAKIRARDEHGRGHALVVVAEGAQSLQLAKEGVHVVRQAAQPGQSERLGGIGEQVAAELEELTGKQARVVVLGHLLRGGSPSSFDRIAAKRFGAAAVRALAQGVTGVMVALGEGHNVHHVPLADVAGRMKGVPLDGDTLQTARDLDICLGD